MTETIPGNIELQRLRECISTVHFLKQAKEFNLITDVDYGKYIKSLNDQTHKITDALIGSIAGV